jgi:DNA polymerase-3 subunit delta
MIIKFFELKKKNIENKKFFLLYGKNKGHIEEVVNENLKPILSKNIFKYEEDEIIKNINNLKENIYNKSFFENDKLIIINRVTDKIYNFIEEVILENSKDLQIILLSGALEKKSKIRNLFEKNKETLCIAFYEDNNQTLSQIVKNYFYKRKISVSQEILNILVQRSKGDRNNLKNELEKIENFSQNGKKITLEKILKITNLSENYDITELVDTSLSNNKNKINKILNENNFTIEDCIIILRTFLSKLKRLLKIHKRIKSENLDIDNAVDTHKPPIFWKEKETVKNQVKSIQYNEMLDLISRANEIELIIKKNPYLSINVTTDFILNRN